MTRWLNVTPLQEPFDSGPDDKGLATFTVNVLVLKEPSDTLALEAIGLMVQAGVGVYGTDIFQGSAFEIPTDRATLAVGETGGTSRLRTQSSKYVRPALQLMARGTDLESAKALCQAALAALEDVENADVDPVDAGVAASGPWIEGGWVDS